MPTPLDQITEMIDQPSLSAISYQARILVEELKAVNDQEYPLEARRIRDLFLCVGDYVLSELSELRDPDSPYKARGDPEFARTRALGELVQELYSCIRYLRASSPGQSPPAIQVALSHLTRTHFPPENGEPICLIRPQWKYNLTCVPITWQLRQIISVGVLDPTGKKLCVVGEDDPLPALWQRWITRRVRGDSDTADASMPQQAAILSFAGLDTHDVLLFPLLAHELGHFIDFSYPRPRHMSDPLKRHLDIKRDQVLPVAKTLYGEQVREQDIEEFQRRLRTRISICLRELLADLLATRMMGLSFFLAQAEFLKALRSWDAPTVTPSGYPSVFFRLRVIFRHLVDPDHGSNVIEFLQEATGIDRDIAQPLLELVEGWRKRLASPPEPRGESACDDPTAPSALDQLDNIAESSVNAALTDLEAVARDIIPDVRFPKLTDLFFERVRRLQQELPPICSGDKPDCFAELMCSAWAYQFLIGDQMESAKNTLEGQFNEYGKTCRLVLKAVELMPVCGKQAASIGMEVRQVVGGAEEAGLLDRPGVLSATDIEARLKLPASHPLHLDVMPLDLDLIQGASLDLRLGNWFATARRTKLKAVPVEKESATRLFMTIGREEFFVPHGKAVLIHPGDLVLGASLEFIALPDDVMAFIVGRSRLGRLGLVVATATQVGPGFHGVAVLELANTGTVPLEIAAGMPVAQLVLQRLTRAVPADKRYRGTFYCQIKPILGP